MGKMDKFKKNGSTNLTADLMQQLDVVLDTKLPEDKDKIVKIALSQIRTNPNNDYRSLDTEESIQALADDIKRNGLMHNLVVSKRKENDYVLLSGERRFKALNLLQNEEVRNGGDAGKYRFVPCRVVENLSERQEMIMLDAANLQTRGSAGNEISVRKAVLRYKDNVTAEYGLSEQEAKKLLQEISAMSKSSINENIQIEDSLDKNLLAMLDSGEITKRNARVFVTLSAEAQKQISDCLCNIKKSNLAETEKEFLFKKSILDFSDAADMATEEETSNKISSICNDVTEKIIKNEISNCSPAVDNVEDNALTEVIKSKEEKIKSQRENYIKKCDKVLRTIKSFSSNKMVKRIKEFDARAEDNDKIIKKIDEFITEAQELRERLKENSET